MTESPLPNGDVSLLMHDPERVPRRTMAEQFQDCVRCSRTCRSIAIRYTADAREYEASGNRRLYTECALEARNYWRRARDYLRHARRFYVTIPQAANSNRSAA